MDEDEDAALERFMQEDALLDAIQYAPDLPGTGATVSLAQASRTAPPRSPAPARAPGIVSLARDHGAAGARGAEEHARNSAALATAYHEALRHGQSCAGAAASTAARGRGAAAAGGEDTSYAAALAPRQPLEVEAAGPSGPTPRRPAAKATGVPLQAVPLAVAALMGMWFFGPSLYEEPERHPLMPAAAPAGPKDVKIPTATVDDEHNSTVQEGSQRFSGLIGVAFSSDAAANASAAAHGNTSAGNATEAIRAGRADRRRGMRIRTGAKDLT